MPTEPPSSHRLAPAELSGRNVHFVGIGGCGMSGLARVVQAAGARCTGSDRSPSPFTDPLLEAGFDITFDQGPQALPANCDLVVISAALTPDHPEVAEAVQRDVPVLKYAQMLGQVMIGREGVAIAGTHGKSTTTAMLAHALLEGGLDPGFIIGANCDQIGGNARAGGSRILLGEACEFDRSFHNLHPRHGVILNVEEDHLDIYGSLDAIIEAFAVFAQRVHPDGSLLIGHEGAQKTVVTAGLPCAVQTIGFAPQADWQVTATATSEASGTADSSHAQLITIGREGQAVCQFTLALPGEHMAYNAAVAAVTAHRLGAEWSAIGAALSAFVGLDRRMQLLGTHRGVTVVDDYGHHPTEIDTTLRALRGRHRPQERGGRLICVFQPHQHSRTRFLLDQFAASFSQADLVIVPQIYFVRDSDEDRRAVNSADLVERLQQGGIEAVHIDRFEDIVAHLHDTCRPGDLLVVMGAGPVGQVAHQFVAREAASV